MGKTFNAPKADDLVTDLEIAVGHGCAAGQACFGFVQHLDRSLGGDFRVIIDLNRCDGGEMTGQIKGIDAIALPFMEINGAWIEQQRRTGLIKLPDDRRYARCAGIGSSRRGGILKDHIHPFDPDPPAPHFLDLNCYRVTAGAAQADPAPRVTFTTPEQASIVQL